MVKLTKIYTRSGDQGSTGLGTGERIHKSHPRVEAYGQVDEANACIGIAICSASSQEIAIAKALSSIQHDLFDLGADLCTPIQPSTGGATEPENALRIQQSQITAIEHLIDQYNKELSPLSSFVLPGGSKLASNLHLARTVCRRAERSVAQLIEVEPEGTSILTLMYLNRLSDLLFVLSRFANDGGRGDVLWIPGKNRSDTSKS